MSDAREEDDVLEFLNSLPEDKRDAATATKVAGTNDQEILEFLDQFDEAKSKSNDQIAQAKPSHKATPPAETEVDLDEKPAEPEILDPEPTTEPVSSEGVVNSRQVADPITSFSKWWSNEGSAKMNSRISSLWGTAQSIGEQAKETADSAIKKAREQGLEDNLKHAFNELGISGVLEGDRELTSEERAKLNQLPDAKKAMESLHKGLGLFSNQVTSVLEKLNLKDEVLDIKLVHDLKNYTNLAGFVKHNFADVMNAQVDGRIEVKVAQSGTKTEQTGDRDLGLFQGKISDADRLVKANIESIMEEKVAKKVAADSEAAEKSKPADDDDDNEPATARQTHIYIGLLAVSVSKEDKPATEEGRSIEIDEYQASSFCFMATLVDKTHDITITNRSQPFPLKWCRWLNGEYLEGETGEDDEVDPASWVAEWVESGLDQTFGVMAQTYTIMRMGY